MNLFVNSHVRNISELGFPSITNDNFIVSTKKTLHNERILLKNVHQMIFTESIFFLLFLRIKNFETFVPYSFPRCFICFQVFTVFRCVKIQKWLETIIAYYVKWFHTF